MEEYKGIYYGDDSEKKYFEGGAHFKYIKLYQRLEQLYLEQKLKEKEKEKELYVKSKLSNRLNNNINNPKKEKKSRNIQDYFDNNMISTSLTGDKNKSYSNNAFTKFYYKKGINKENLTNNKTNYLQTYILIKNKDNKEKDKSYGKTKSFAIKNQKKIIISRNKIPSMIFKARPNTIKKGIQNFFFFGKNNLISNSMEQRKNNKKVLNENLNKRSFPNINNLISGKINNKFKKNESYLEVNKIGGKTDRSKIVIQTEKWNQSQNIFGKIKIRLNSTSAKNPKNKIKKKNYVLNESRKIQERTKSNFTNIIYKKIKEQFSNKKEKENEGKKEPILKKSTKKKNININKKYLFQNNNLKNISTTKSKLNVNNQIKKIIYNPNITEKIDKKMFTNLNKISIKGKSRNINVGLNEINDSFNIKTNPNIKSRNNAMLNTSRNKNNDNFKTTFKILSEKIKIPNIKQNNIIFLKTNKIKKYSPKVSNKINKTPIKKNIINNNTNKITNYGCMLNKFPMNKEKILQNINNSNNLNGLKDKTLNINIINNTCIYIKPKRSKCGIKNQSRNEKIQTDIKPINYTQGAIMKKKKPMTKLVK